MARRRPTGEWAVFASELGVNIQRLRVARGLTQEDVAYAAGISRNMFQRFENGESMPSTPANPSLRNLLAIAQVLDVDLNELLPAQRPDLRIGRLP